MNYSELTRIRNQFTILPVTFFRLAHPATQPVQSLLEADYSLAHRYLPHFPCLIITQFFTVIERLGR